MAQSSRIKTPFKQHLHRFRLGALPVISFIACVALTLWLWNRQVTIGSLLGEVEAQSVTVVAGTNGRILARADGTYLKRHDRVQAGELLVKLDDAELQGRMQTVRATNDRLLADIEAARSNFRLDELNIDQNEVRQQARLQLEVGRLHVEGLQQQGVVNELETQLKGVQAMLRFARILDPLQRQQRQNEADTLTTRLAAERKVLQRIHSQFAEANKQAAAYQDIVLPKVDTVVAPIHAEIKVQQAVMEEINIEMQKLMITAPIDGIVTEVLRMPDEQIMAGDPIATIVRPETQVVVSYIRENQRVTLIEGMEVGLRLRDNPGEEYVSRVQRVGPNVQPVPPHQLSDATMPEWGSPIYIPIPPKLQQQDRVRPGQLLQVIIHRQRQRR